MIQGCFWHPNRTTRISCSRCGTAICTDCVHQHPVGIRCRDCHRATKIPTYRVSRSDLAKGISTGILMTVVGGAVLFLIEFVVSGGILSLVGFAAVGYMVGECISLAVNRKRGGYYQLISGVSGIGAVIVFLSLMGILTSALVLGPTILLGSLITLVITVSKLKA